MAPPNANGDYSLSVGEGNDITAGNYCSKQNTSCTSPLKIGCSDESLTNGSAEDVGGMAGPSDAASNSRPGHATPEPQTAATTEWTVGKIANRLKTYSQEVRDGHAQLTAYVIESTSVPDRRVFHGRDLFASVNIKPVPEKKGKTMRIKFKQHIKAKKDQREEHYMAVCIKTNKDAVPSYRFHTEINKNILGPNTMLTSVRHLRDLQSSEEAKYNLWLKELEDIDIKSGFKPMQRDQKHTLTVQSERAATVSLYLNRWLGDLKIPYCNKSTLIRHMASQQSDNVMTPRQKMDTIRSHSDGDNMTPEAVKAAEMFTAAFQLTFKEGRPISKQIDLRTVLLLLDESVDSVMGNKSAAKEIPNSQHDNEDEVTESNLATYCIIGCLVCFSHSCDHGECLEEKTNWYES